MHTRRIQRLPRSPFRSLAIACIAWLALASGVVPSVGAQDSSYMINMLRSSTSFRVRTSAAQRLGDGTPSAAVTAALVTALRDAEDSVRAAAASSLGRVGDASALTPLRALSTDPVPAVRTAAAAAITAISTRGSGGGTGTGTGTGTTPPPSGPARFYIGVGDPGSTVAGIDRTLLTSGRTVAVTAVTAMSGVVVAPAGETAAQARSAINARHLRGYFLDISITDLTTRPDGAIHAAVSVVVQDYPSHNIRSMLSGNATASGVSGLSGQRAVIQAAIQGALRGLTTAMGP